jgi:hypothetical protein
METNCFDQTNKNETNRKTLNFVKKIPKYALYHTVSNKELASRLRVSGSRQASLQYRLDTCFHYAGGVPEAVVRKGFDSKRRG